MIFRSGSRDKTRASFCKLSRDLGMRYRMRILKIYTLMERTSCESSISRRRDDNGNNSTNATTDTTERRGGKREMRENQ